MPVEFTDLTLREGPQSPGFELDEQTGKEVLTNLAELGVDWVEIAFPRAEKRESLFRHADRLGLRTVALARAVEADLDAALAVNPDAVEIDVVASDVQLEHALGKSRAESRELLEQSVEYVTGRGVDAGVTLMDAIRADNAFLRELARSVADVGGKHVTIADTVGCGWPNRVAQTVGAIADEVGGEIDIAIHTHDDMGVAAANALAGVEAGATMVDATVAGVGERAGNAPLEEVAVLLSESGAGKTALNVGNVIRICQKIAEALELDLPETKPLLGPHVFSHESGMHTAAMLREPSTYEPFDPGRYGSSRELLFGSGTGRGSARELLRKLDIEPTDQAVAEALQKIEDAAEREGRPLRQREALEYLSG